MIQRLAAEGSGRKILSHNPPFELRDVCLWQESQTFQAGCLIVSWGLWPSYRKFRGQALRQRGWMMGVHQSMERPGQDETARKKCPFLLGTRVGRGGWPTTQGVGVFHHRDGQGHFKNEGPFTLGI